MFKPDTQQIIHTVLEASALLPGLGFDAIEKTFIKSNRRSFHCSPSTHLANPKMMFGCQYKKIRREFPHHCP